MCETSDEKQLNQLINQMFEKIANKQNVFFKSQQKDETDLTVTQKQLIVKTLFNDSKQLFLQRYGSVLSDEELDYFDEFKDNSEINLVLKTLRECREKSKQKSLVRNRRFQTLQQLIQKGDYFSDIQMKERNPLLFEQMIGQYMTEEEKIKLTNDKYYQNHQRVTLSSFLLEQIDNNFNTNRINSEEIEEFDSDSDDDDDSDDVEEEIKNKCLEDSEKQELRDEFTKLMAEQFLSGKDTEFYDYNESDNNMDLDFNEITERDIEDKYFENE